MSLMPALDNFNEKIKKISFVKALDYTLLQHIVKIVIKDYTTDLRPFVNFNGEVLILWVLKKNNALIHCVGRINGAFIVVFISSDTLKIAVSNAKRNEASKLALWHQIFPRIC